MEKAQLVLKFKVKNFDDLQRLRIQCGGRTLNRATEIHLKGEDVAYFRNLKKSLHGLEKDALKQVAGELEAFPIYTDWLSKIRGIGPTMASVIISEFDIRKATTVSKLWAFSGLHVVDGKAPKPVPGKKLTYNKWLRTKLLGVLADSFIKQKSGYSKLYYAYKHRKASQGWGGFKDKNGVLKSVDGHRHNAAKRYMVKMFLKDLFLRWRQIEGLPIRPSYQEQYLGHSHGSGEDRGSQAGQ